jgi:DNA-binding Lrp family transcriptional regulator
VAQRFPTTRLQLFKRTDQVPRNARGDVGHRIGQRRFRGAMPLGRVPPRHLRGTPMRAIFVQIKCEMGQAYKVAREAADTVEQMSELYSTSGQYDLLGKFYLEPEQDIGLFVTEKIQTLAGVKDTYTLITFNAFGGGRA